MAVVISELYNYSLIVIEKLSQFNILFLKKIFSYIVKCVIKCHWYYKIIIIDYDHTQYYVIRNTIYISENFVTHIEITIFEKLVYTSTQW